jgi:hypothetical protein
MIDGLGLLLALFLGSIELNARQSHNESIQIKLKIV